MQTILVVDDTPANLGILFECLNHAGFKTLVAEDGSDAVEMAWKVEPDLILLDVIMPEMDGFTTCRKLKENPVTASIPVIFMTALTDTQEKITGFDCGAVDYICKPFQQEEVLARIHLHLTLEKQRQDLMRMVAEKEKMISVVAHDLKDPFSGMFGSLELLSNDYDNLSDLERKTFIGYLGESAQTLFRVVDNLLNWIRSGNGQLECIREPVNLLDLVTSVTHMVRTIAENKQIALSVNVAEQYTIYADADMMAAVFRNLVTNALKFTHEGGRVTIAATKNGNGRICVEVMDTGVGMHPEVVERIRNPVDRFTTLGTSSEKGTGLGLMICREFIGKNNGTLEVDSQPGKGSCFRVILQEASGD